MSQSFILDSSLALSWCFESEVTEATQEILASLAAGATAFVPALWAWEAQNVLCMAERNKRHTAASRQQKLAILRSLPIELDPFAHQQALGETGRLAQEHKISVYDAAYLEMALRLGLPLGSLDTGLRAAAKKTGVKCLPDKI
jgi:predicted nucleic acid-binding protein